MNFILKLIKSLQQYYYILIKIHLFIQQKNSKNSLVS